ncbi:hypothetical protein BO70DRAFT_428551 [Aspergillus heteromorphus CBS 117.55]|uniref:Heat shock factor binding protein 1-domain-containing protein n=1 Tax=Aspergillus heteromorphus CBS 117.55 TaxID=1448321 RepID=A0A317WEV1_9EURO|nr:uncharacterized protein BO70DRAFT_428551 [Aspergillus heteromorphus CBS 117.55]PWY84964.1 hypothetical protein BO70DRAFT_428551 [Aspergillus heteromorphus CBS 117.55]
MSEESPLATITDSVTAPTTSTQTPDPQNQFTAAVDDLLDQLQHKFDGVSREMFGKLDDMARRLDELEASFTVVDGTASATASAAAAAAAGGESPAPAK